MLVSVVYRIRILELYLSYAFFRTVWTSNQNCEEQYEGVRYLYIPKKHASVGSFAFRFYFCLVIKAEAAKNCMNLNLWSGVVVIHITFQLTTIKQIYNVFIN